MTVVREAEAVVLGAGLSGVAAAIRLQRDSGLTDVVVLDQDEGFGGTWRVNTYPGCACDIPSSLMSYEFAPNPDWHRIFAHQAELLAYLERVAHEHRLDAITQFGTTVHRAAWDETERHWVIETSRGTYTAPVFVAAPGGLQAPLVPDIPGRDTFAGAQVHTARWHEAPDLRGKRVAVIGAGATAIQLIPSIQPEVAHLVSLQRTPGWVWPKADWKTTRLERWALRRFPKLHRGLRWLQFSFGDALLKVYMRERAARTLNLIGRAHLRVVVKDRALRRRLTPDFTMGCKRIMLDNYYYPSLNQPNVEVRRTGLKAITPTSIIGDDGSEHEVDVIVWATGFHASDPPIGRYVTGREGRTLAEVWGPNPRAYMGASVAGFPNFFLLWGPNVGTACNFVMIEAQLNYATRALNLLRGRKAAALDIRPDVVDAFKQDMQTSLAESTWVRGGCVSWYMDAAGDNYTVYGGTMRHMLSRSQQVDASMFDEVAA